MTIDIVTIFPEFFAGPFEHGIIRRALRGGMLKLGIHDLRQFTEDRHRTVDDRPFGGEEGMVLKPDPLFKAVAALRADDSLRPSPGRVVLMSAQGRLFRQAQAAQYAKEEQLILLCGRYEGVNERVAECLADDEISIGDYVLSGGELAAAVVVDTVARLLPGVLGNAQSAIRESFAAPAGLISESDAKAVGILDCPHYTRPAVFEFDGQQMPVPEALLSGNHKQIKEWRRRKALEKTFGNRPDLLRDADLDAQQQIWLSELKRAGQVRTPGNNPEQKEDES